MRRRELLAVLAVAMTFPAAARAQQPNGRVARIAMLGASSPGVLDPRQIEQFKQGLVENGLIDGRNISVQYFWSEGRADRMQQLASELAKAELDVIVTAGPQPLRALVDAHTQTPIVVAIINDPVGSGFIDSLSHPGGNITGLSMLNSDLEGKRIAILKDAVPTLTNVMILHDPTMSPEGVPEAKATAQRLGLTSNLFEPNDPAVFEAVFAKAIELGANGVLVMTSPFLNFNRRKIFELTARYRLPAIYATSTYADDGGLMSYGPNFPDMYRRSAGLIARILKGTRPADLPVEQPTKFELAINLKTARALGITIPAAMLATADEVIE